MSENDRYGGAHLLIAFLAGAAAGAAVALLTAPQSGRETRAKVRSWTQDLGSKAQKVPGAVHEAYDRAAEAARRAFTDAMRDTDESSETA